MPVWLADEFRDGLHVVHANGCLGAHSFLFIVAGLPQL